MLLHKLVLLVGGLVLGCALGATPGHSAEIETLVERLPSTTNLVLASHDIGATCAAFERTPLGQEFCGKSFAPLVAELRKLDQGGPLHMRPWIGFDWPDLAKMESPAVLASFPLGHGGAGMIWMFPGDTYRDTLFEKVNAYYAKKKWAAVKAKAGAANIVIYRPPGKAGGLTNVWYETKDFYGVANNSEAIVTVLKTEAEKSFAASSQGKSFLATAGELDGARFFVEPLALWSSLRVPPPGQKRRLKDPVAVAQRLGLGGIKSMIGTIVLDPEKGDAWELRTDLVVPPPYQKALKALALLPGPAAPLPAWVANDASSVTRWNWDFERGMEGFGHLFDETTEPGPDGEGLFEQIIDGLLEDPEGPKVDLRKNLFANLGPEVLAVTSPADQSLYVANCKKEAVVRKTLNDFYKGDKAVTKAAVGDYDMWSVAPGAGLFVEGEGEGDELLNVRGVAVGDGQLWIATDPGYLLETLKHKAKGGHPKPLAETGVWAEYDAWTKDRAGKGTALDGWTRSSLSWETAYETARTPPKPKAEDGMLTQLWLFLLFGTSERTAKLPYKFAPAYAVWTDKLPPIGEVFSQTETGWSSIVGAPTAAGAK